MNSIEIEKLYQQAVDNFHEAPPKYNISFCIKVWTQLIEQYQHAGSMAYLSRCYKYGIGVRQNENLYLNYISRSSKLGNNYAIGICHCHAINCIANYEKSMQCYEQCLKDKTEVSLALCAMGYMYEHGFHVTKNLAQAYSLYKQSASLGCAIGIVNVANCLKVGKGTATNISQAAIWYKTAADKGDCESQYNYSVYLKEGKGVERDLTLSIKYFTMAANNFHVKALDILVDLYFNGSSAFNIQRDYKKALHFLKVSEQIRLTGKIALFLGQIYYLGLGCTIDYIMAFMYFNKSIVDYVDYSNPKRFYFRGICYFNGLGNSKDYVKAALDLKTFINGFAIANTQEYVDAKLKLAYIYEYGKLGERDIHTAIELYKENAIYDKISQNSFNRLKSQI